jgi:hypothetical protein
VTPARGRLAASLAALWGLANAVASLRAAPAGAVPSALATLLAGAVALAFALLSAAAMHWPGGVPWRTLAGGPPDARPRHGAVARAVRGFFAGLAAAVPVLGLAAFAGNLLESLGFAPEQQPAVGWMMDPATPPAAMAAIAAMAVLFAPLAEEILYRALLFGGLAAQGRSTVRAAILSSLFFAALHLSLAAVPPLFALALFLCLLWRRWGLSASVGAHAGFNAANFALAAFFLR